MGHNDRRFDRRQFIKVAGVAGTTGVLAGCTGGDGGGDGGDGGGDGGDGGGGGGSGGDGGDGGDGGGTEVQYPTEDITFVVPYGTGGGFDYYSRTMKPYWEEYLPGDATVTVENITGGGGARGVTEVWNQEGDGHWMTIGSGTLAKIQIGRDVAYDVREMGKVGIITQSPNALVVADRLGLESWDDLVSRASEFNWATQGVGTAAHINPIVLAEMTGAFSSEDLNFVHYDGTGPAITGIQREEASAIMPGAITAAANAVAGSEGLTTLVTFSAPDEVLETYQEITQIFSSELDVDNMDVYNRVTRFTRFVLTPPGVSEDVLSIQREAFGQIVEDEDFLTQVEEADRPIMNPQVGDAAAQVMQEKYDTFSQSPYAGMLQEAMN